MPQFRSFGQFISNFCLPSAAKAASLPLHIHNVRVFGSLLFLASCFALSIAALPRAAAATSTNLTRGPYLQRGNTTNVLVRWRTDQPAASIVYYGTNRAYLSGSAIEATPKTEHELLLPNLIPDTGYFYSVQTADLELAGGPSCFFVTAPVASRSTRIWVLGDSGTRTPDQLAVRDAYYTFTGTRHTDLWLMLGDNAYSQGLDFVYQAALFNVYPDMLRKSVLWPAIGNHEIVSTDPQGTDFPFLHIFSLPNHAEAGGTPSGSSRYYSYDYGNIHFICLDSESSKRTPPSPMLQWLEADLTANTNLWRIAYWHSPPYSHGSHSSDLNVEQIEMRQYAVPLLESHGVDLVLCGHSHCYERSFLLDGHYGTSDTLQPSMRVNPGDGRRDGTGPYFKADLPHKGTVYVVAGCSGQIDGSGTLDHPAMFTSQSALGSVVLDIDGGTLDARFLKSDGSIGDYFTIIKGPSPDNFLLRSIAIHDRVATITWTSIAGHYYALEFKADVDEAGWTEVAEPSFATGTASSWTGLLPLGATNGFFRVSSQLE